jgi:hypothetical protein
MIRSLQVQQRQSKQQLSRYCSFINNKNPSTATSFKLLLRKQLQQQQQSYHVSLSTLTQEDALDMKDTFLRRHCTC